MTTYAELLDAAQANLAYELWRQTGEAGDGNDTLRAAFMAGYRAGYRSGYSQGEADAATPF